MWLSWSLLIKDDGNTKKAWRLRACSFGHSPSAHGIEWILTDDWGLAPVNEWSHYHCGFKLPGARKGQRNLKWKTTDRTVFVQRCAMAAWHTRTHRLSMSDSDDNSFTSGMDFIAPILTGGSATAFSSFRAVLSFSTSLGKEEKSNSFGYLKPQLCAVSHLEKPAQAAAVLLQAVAFQERDSSDVRQKELQKHTINESVTPKPVSLSCLRNFC